MAKEESEQEKKMSRRTYAVVAGAGIAGLAIGAAAGYFAAPPVERTITQTVTQTTTRTVTATPTPTPKPTPGALPTKDELIADAEEAGIDWRQCEGEEIHCAVLSCPWTPPHRELAAIFEEISGVKVVIDEYSEEVLNDKEFMDWVTTKTFYYTLINAQAEGLMPALWKAGAAQNFDEYFNNPETCNLDWYDMDDVMPVARDKGLMPDGGHYIQPFHCQVGTCYYNEELLAKAGLEPPMNIEEMQTFAKEFKEKMAPEHYGWAAVYASNPAVVLMMAYLHFMYPYGGTEAAREMDRKPLFFDEDWNPTISNRKWMIEATKDWIKTADYGPPGLKGWTWVECHEAFMGGILGLAFLATPHSAPFAGPESKASGKAHIYHVPVGLPPDGPIIPHTAAWSWALAKPIPEKRRRAGALFTIWETSKLPMAYWHRKIPVPWRLSHYTDPGIVAACSDPTKQAIGFLEADKNAKAAAKVNYWIKIPEANELYERWGTEIENMYVGKKSVEQGFKDTEAEWRKVLDEAGYYG